MRFQKFCLAFFLLLGSAFAQTTVTATVVDPNGNPYANGTASAYTLTPSGSPFQTTTPVATTITGSFTMSLPANTYIFTICSLPTLLGFPGPTPNPSPTVGNIPATNPTPQQICFTSPPLAISGGSMDISTQLNAVALILGPPSGSGASINCQLSPVGSLAGASSSNSLRCDPNMGTDFAGNGFSQSWKYLGPVNGFFGLIGGTVDPGTQAKFKLNTNEVRMLAPLTAPTPYYWRIPGTRCTTGQGWQMTGETTDANGDKVDAYSCAIFLFNPTTSQDFTLSGAPANPVGGFARTYGDSTTNNFTCLLNVGNCGFTGSQLRLPGSGGNQTIAPDSTGAETSIVGSGGTFKFNFCAAANHFSFNRDCISGAMTSASVAGLDVHPTSSTTYGFDVYNGSGSFLGTGLSLAGTSLTAPNLIATTNVQGATGTIGKINNTVYVDGTTNTTIAAAVTALGSSDGTIVVPAGTYTSSANITIGSTTQQVMLLLRRGVVLNITQTGGGTAIFLGKYSTLQCEQGATINITASASLADVVANLTQDSTQEAAYVNGCLFQVASGATVSGAVIHFKRIYANSAIQNVVIVSPPHYGIWLDAGTGGGLGISNVSVYNSWITAGSALTGSVACAVSGSNGAGNITFLASQCEHSGLYDIYLDGLGGAGLGGVHHVAFLGTGVESVTGQTGAHIYIRDSHDVTFDTLIETGVSTNDMFQLSQSGAGLTYNIHLRNIASNETTGNLVNNTINSVTIPLTSAVQGRNSYDYGGFSFQDGTTILGNGLIIVGNKTFLASDFTLAANTSLQTVLSWSLPANQAVNASFHCSLNYSQATANVAMAFGIQGATVTPTNINANGTLYTSTTALTTGTLNGLNTTTAANIVSATPSATATVFKAELDGTVEEPSNASAPVINIMASQSNSGDLVTVKRGSYCTLF